MQKTLSFFHLSTGCFRLISWSVLVVFVLILRIPSFYSTPVYDEVIYLDFGKRIAEGAVLYKDIWDNKPPFIYYLHSLSWILFGGNYIPFRLLDIAFIVIQVYCTYKITLLLIGKKIPLWARVAFLLLASIIISLFFDRIFFFNAESVFVTAIVGGLYCYMLYLRSQREKKLYLVIALLAWSVAVSTKVIAFGEIFFLVGASMRLYGQFNIRRWLIHASIAAVPLLIYALLPLYGGYLSEYLQAMGLFFLHYAYDPIDRIVTNSVFDLTGFRVLLAGVMLAAIYIYIKNLKTQFILGWLVTTVFLSTLSWKLYSHYFQQFVPPLLIVMFFVSVLWRFKSKNFEQWPSYFLRATGLIILVSILIIPALFLCSRIDFELEWWRSSWAHNFYNAKSRSENTQEANKDFQDIITKNQGSRYWLLNKSPMSYYFYNQLPLAVPYYMPVNSIYLSKNTLLNSLQKWDRVIVVTEHGFNIKIPINLVSYCKIQDSQKIFEVWECNFKLQK